MSIRAQAQSTEPFPAAFELSSLLPINGGDGSDGFVLNGIDADDRSGNSVSSAGDVNGDGHDDLIIGARSASPFGEIAAGESYVVFGGAGVGASGSFELSSLNGTNGFVLNGIDGFAVSGNSVSSAGDVNGDGIGDLIIGSPGAEPDGLNRAGESYVVFGATDLGDGGLGTGGSFNLSSLIGTNGFAIEGIVAKDYSGVSVSSAGDVNGDGFDDLIIGANFAKANDKFYAGESYVVFGAADLSVGGVGAGGSFNPFLLNGTNGFVLNGIDHSDYSGYSVSSAGDVNGDGIDDLIIGSSAGEGYVVFGAADLGVGGVGTGGSFNLSSLNGVNGFVLNGSARSVSSAGDVNSDGIGDLVISGLYVYVVFGATDMGTGGVGTGGSLDLSSLNGANGFVLNGNDGSAGSVSSVGDMNGDGIGDLVIGANNADPNGLNKAGESYIIFGSADLGVGGMGTGGVFDLSSLNGTNGFVLNGIDPDDWSGWSVSTAGDVNDDGIADLIIGATRAAPNGKSYAGETYVVYGRDLSPCLPDLNGDSIVDLGDIQAFVTLFLDSDLAADFNGDGILDLGDISAFVAAFLDGC